MRALVAMSGGVDSAVSALLMKEKCESAGGIMRLRDVLDEEMTEGVRRDISDAESVARRLGMDFHVFDLREQFLERVIQDFVQEYLNGKTPNPCIVCNRFLKFDAFYEEGRKLGYDRIATGHYARVEEREGRFVLKRGKDPNKDQSYVLYTLTQEQLSHTDFPLGDLDKTEVRRIAEENGFINAHKKDSQDICFVADGKYADIIRKVTGSESVPGDFVDESGKVLGRHKGIIYYTVGQHRGLGLPTEIPLYVKNIDAKANRIVLCENENLFTEEVEVNGFNWIAGFAAEEGKRGTAKIRYRHREQPCTILYDSEGGVKIRFDEPQRAPTPGQSCVVYDGDIVLGGGIIR